MGCHDGSWAIAWLVGGFLGLLVCSVDSLFVLKSDIQW